MVARNDDAGTNEGSCESKAHARGLQRWPSALDRMGSDFLSNEERHCRLHERFENRKWSNPGVQSAILLTRLHRLEHAASFDSSHSAPWSLFPARYNRQCYGRDAPPAGTFGYTGCKVRTSRFALTDENERSAFHTLCCSLCVAVCWSSRLFSLCSFLLPLAPPLLPVRP